MNKSRLVLINFAENGNTPSRDQAEQLKYVYTRKIYKRMKLVIHNWVRTPCAQADPLHSIVRRASIRVRRSIPLMDTLYCDADLYCGLVCI